MANIWNLSTIRQEIKDRLHQAALSDAKVDRWVNEAQDRIFRELDLDTVQRTSTITTAANTGEYYLETGYHRITSIVDETANRA